MLLSGVFCFTYICQMGIIGTTTSLWQQLTDLDRWLFVQLNSKLTNPAFDTLFPYFRDSVFWAPLYIFLFAFIVFNFGKKGWKWSVAFLATIAVTDLCGTYLFKQNFQRLRPCQDPVFYTQVRLLLKNCSGGYSFLSNHAANHFGLATFMMLTLKPVLHKWIYLFLIWAVLIAYSQIYVGVHYPSDVIAGALLGTLAGWLIARGYQKNVGYLALTNN